MTKKQVVELYGKSIYTIRLELALWHYYNGAAIEPAWKQADEFVKYMQSNEHKPLED